MTDFMCMLQVVYGTTPDPPCGEFDIEAVAEDGTRRRVPLADVLAVTKTVWTCPRLCVTGQQLFLAH